MWPHVEIDAFAATRHGLITLAELLRLGLSRRQAMRAVARGELEIVRPSVYRVRGAPRTRDQALLAAVLASRSAAVLSHGTAARAFGLRGFPEPDVIDLLTTGVRPVLDGVRGHRTKSLPESDRTRVRRVPVTTAERTLVDACGLIYFSAFERSVDDALRRELIQLPKLVSTFEDIPVSGRRARRPMERVLAERLPGFHPGGSGEELDVLWILKRAGISPLPIQQYRVVLEGFTYDLDYAWPDTLTALEYDGRAFHTRVSEFHYDQDRIRRLQRAHWTRWPITKRTSPNEIIAVGLTGIGAPRGLTVPCAKRQARGGVQIRHKASSWGGAKRGRSEERPLCLLPGA